MSFIQDLARSTELAAKWAKIVESLNPKSQKESSCTASNCYEIWRATWTFDQLKIEVFVTTGDGTHDPFCYLTVQMADVDGSTGACLSFWPMEEGSILGEFVDSTDDDKAPGHDQLDQLGHLVEEHGVDYIFDTWLPEQLAT